MLGGGLADESRAAERETKERPQVLDLAADVAPSAACRVQRSGGVEGQRRDRRDPDRGAAVGALAGAGDVDLGGEAGRQPHLRAGRRRHQQEDQQREDGAHQL